jgi:hypothetical protein
MQMPLLLHFTLVTLSQVSASMVIRVLNIANVCIPFTGNNLLHLDLQPKHVYVLHLSA